MKLQDIAIVRKFRRDHFSITPSEKITVRENDVIVPCYVGKELLAVGHVPTYFVARENDERVRSGDTIVRLTSNQYSPDALLSFLIYANAHKIIADRSRIETLEIPELTEGDVKTINQVNELIELKRKQLELFDELKMSVIHHAMQRGKE